jgi:hypothetical protein
VLSNASLEQLASDTAASYPHNWVAISEAFGGVRTAEQCRHHWVYTLRDRRIPGIKVGIWSEEEVCI